MEVKQKCNLRRAGWLLLITMICSGCGTPGKYHFWHYHRPFKAVAESNKTYFHSSQTGRIIEKDPCATYCEPGCFGFEPTCWTQWPAECPGNCPVQGEVISDEPIPMEFHEGAVIEGSGVISPTADYPAYDGPSDNVPKSANESLRPSTIPSLPVDIESAVPSPSDSTDNGRNPINASELAAQPQREASVAPPVSSRRVTNTATQRIRMATLPQKAKPSSSASLKASALDRSQPEKLPEVAIEKVVPPTQKKRLVVNDEPEFQPIKPNSKLVTKPMINLRATDTSAVVSQVAESAKERSAATLKWHPASRIASLETNTPPSEKPVAAVVDRPELKAETRESVSPNRVTKQVSTSIQLSDIPVKETEQGPTVPASADKGANAPLSLGRSADHPTVIRFATNSGEKQQPVRLGSLDNDSALRFR